MRVYPNSAAGQTGVRFNLYFDNTGQMTIAPSDVQVNVPIDAVWFAKREAHASGASAGALVEKAQPCFRATSSSASWSWFW
jgi:hypothetical protein